MSYIGIVGDYIKRKIEEGKVVIEVKSKNLPLRARGFFFHELCNGGVGVSIQRLISSCGHSLSRLSLGTLLEGLVIAQKFEG